MQRRDHPNDEANVHAASRASDVALILALALAIAMAWLLAMTGPAHAVNDDLPNAIKVCKTGASWVESSSSPWSSEGTPGMCVCDTGWDEVDREGWDAQCQPEGLPDGGWYSPCDDYPELCHTDPNVPDGSGGGREPSQVELCAECSRQQEQCRAAAQVDFVHNRWKNWELANSLCGNEGLDAYNRYDECLIRPFSENCYEESDTMRAYHQYQFASCVRSWMEGGGDVEISPGVGYGPVSAGVDVQIAEGVTYDSFDDMNFASYKARLDECIADYRGCRRKNSCRQVSPGTGTTPYSLSFDSNTIYTQGDGFEITTDTPEIEGHRVDTCREAGSECGPRAADSFCRVRYGYEAHAVSYLVDKHAGAEAPTIHIGSKQLCEGSNCDALAEVTCYVESLEVDFETPRSDGMRIDYGSGRWTAERFCEDAFGIKASSEGWTYEAVSDQPVVSTSTGIACEGEHCRALSDVTCSSDRLLHTSVAVARLFPDYDADGVKDSQDNCPHVQNGPLAGAGDQLDEDWDGIGDACDDHNRADLDGNGVSDWDETRLGRLFGDLTIRGGDTLGNDSSFGQVITGPGTVAPEAPTVEPEPEPEPEPSGPRNLTIGRGSLGGSGSLLNW